jgi:hypothetical protein
MSSASGNLFQAGSIETDEFHDLLDQAKESKSIDTMILAKTAELMDIA